MKIQWKNSKTSQDQQQQREPTLTYDHAASRLVKNQNIPANPLTFGPGKISKQRSYITKSLMLSMD